VPWAIIRSPTINIFKIQDTKKSKLECQLKGQRRETVEHPFGTIKSWMGATHFQMKTLKKVRTEMALHVLAYNLKRVMNILGRPQCGPEGLGSHPF